jgi:hypothetical protein
MSVVTNQNIGHTVSTFSRTMYESLPDFIKISDTDDESGLSNFCYVADPPQTQELQDNISLIKDCRGVVFHGENLIMKAFPYTEQVGVSYDLYSWFSENGGFENCRFYESHEGALIRMFHHNGKWFLTTHRRLNAFKSKWGSSESYGSLFKKALKSQIDSNETLRNSLPDNDGNYYDNFQSVLDISKQYTFLVKNSSENRLVCDSSVEPTMYHVGTFSNSVLDLNDDINVWKPKEHTFAGISEMSAFISSTDPSKTPGIIIFSSIQTQLKVSSDMYLTLVGIRGNEPSVRYRYLQVRMDAYYNDMLRRMYPELVDSFDQYEVFIRGACGQIHTSYINRFVHKQHTRVSQAEYAIVRIAHDWFKEGREIGENRRVTNLVITNIMNEQPATTLNAIIKKIKHDKYVSQKEVDTTPNEVDAVMYDIVNATTDMTIDN